MKYIERSVKLITNRHTEILVLALLPLLIMMRAAIPYLEYLFILLNAVYVPIVIRNIKNNYTSIKWYSFTNFIPYLLVSITFIIAFLITSTKSFLINRELLVCLYFLYYIIIFKLSGLDNDDIAYFTKTLKKLIIIITFIAAFLGIIKLLFELLGVRMEILSSGDIYPFGSSLKIDHNFFALSLLIGMILFFDYITKSPLNKNSKSLVIAIYTFGILFTSSRRGIVVLLILFIAIILQKLIKRTRNKAPLFSFKMILQIFSSILILFLISFLFLKVRSKNNFEIRQKTAYLLYDYSSLLTDKTYVNSIYYLLWHSNYMSDWSENNIDKTPYLKKFYESRPKPIEIGMNNMSVCLDTIPDWNLNMATYISKHTSNMDSFLAIEGYEQNAGVYKFIKFDSTISKVYITLYYRVEIWHPDMCLELRWNNEVQKIVMQKSGDDSEWVRKDIVIPFNNSKVLQIIFRVHGKGVEDYSRVLINNMIVSLDPINTSNTSIQYSSNGFHPPLSDSITKTVQIIPVELFSIGNIQFGQFNIRQDSSIYTFLDSLAGSVFTDLIAPFSQFWEFSADALVYSAERNLRLEIENFTRNNYSGKRLTTLSVDNNFEYQHLSTFIYAQKGDSLRFSIRHFDNHGEQLVLWRNLKICSYPFENIIDRKEDYVIPPFDSLKAYIKNQSLTKEINKKEYNRAMYPRIERWRFALGLYADYSIFEKIFGSGFDYLDNYRDKFSREDNGFDYPHNIILSTLLYSGFIGMLILLWLIIDLSLRFIKLKSVPFIIIWLVTLLFVLLSSDSVFELPLLVGLIVLPYLLNRTKPIKTE
ncbi:MAG TPA: hypothetical protein VMW76_10915 [Bacteroidales bacterium]|nr:hypothetical protein [Bacteroidales bacterium]